MKTFIHRRTLGRVPSFCTQATLSVLLSVGGTSAYAGIIQIDPGSLSGTALVDFEDLGLGDGEQVTFDSTFESGFTLFGESFVGQTVTQSGNFDVLSGTPTDPLTLANGPANQNITAIDGGAGDTGNTAIAGSGPLGYPDPDAVGEGSIAILFDYDQSEFGFDIVGANGGSATAQFWGRDGLLIDEIIFNLGNAIFTSFGFQTDDSSFSIAGVSIFNDDPGGIGFDNFRSDVEGVPGTPDDPGENPVSVPEPSSIFLAMLGIIFIGFSRIGKACA